MPSTSPAAATRTAYDLVARNYARLLPDTAAEAPADLEVIRRFSATVPDDGPILDAGCGTGRMVGHLQGLGHRYLAGVDLSPGMIAQARKGHPGASFTIAELAGLPYPENSFEGILAWYSIIHTAPEELGAIFGQFHRVLRPGGTLLLGFQAGSGARDIRRAYGHDVEMAVHLHDAADLVGRLDAGDSPSTKNCSGHPAPMNPIRRASSGPTAVETSRTSGPGVSRVWSAAHNATAGASPRR